MECAVRRSDKRPCCFCGDSVDDADYIQIDLVMKHGVGQYFGAHRSHLEERLHKGFQIEIAFPGVYEEDPP